MELVQARIVTDDVAALAAFYASLTGTCVVPNDYYVEVGAGPASVGLSRRRFTEYREESCAGHSARCGHMLDFRTADTDAEYERIRALGVDWVMPPTTQPWGNRSMIFTDPLGTLVNVYSPPP